MNTVSTWNRISHEGQRMENVGILADGTLHNPNGYPEDLVRAAIAGAEARRTTRRKEAAGRAAATRQRRQAKRVYDVARKVANGGMFGPSGKCVICHRAVDDEASVKRGVGSDCWQLVLAAIEARP